MKRVLLILLPLWLMACSAPQPRPSLSDPAAVWQHHRTQLADVAQWHLLGRLAIQTGGESWYASIEWKQLLQDYEIRLTAPLGQGTIRLRGNEKVVELSDTDGRTALDYDPETLLWREFGWKVPVASLRFWVLGLPAPGPEQHELDSNGRLSRLLQNDWEIHFLDYTSHQGMVLPRKVFINNHQAEVRLVVNTWQIQPGE